MKSPAACRNLTDVRSAVNAIDRAILKLLGRRTKYAAAALRFKTDLRTIRDNTRRKQLFADRKAWAAKHGVGDRLAKEVFQAIVDESRRMHLAGFRAQRRAG